MVNTIAHTPVCTEQSLADLRTLMMIFADRYMADLNPDARRLTAEMFDDLDTLADEVEKLLVLVYEQRTDLNPSPAPSPER